MIPNLFGNYCRDIVFITKKDMLNWQNPLTGLNEFECPNCKYDFLEEGFNFCPHCGVKLDWRINENISTA